MYTCRICNFVSEAGQPQYKHVIYREDKSISREIPVCYECKDDLDAGIPLKMMLQEQGTYKKIPVSNSVNTTSDNPVVVKNATPGKKTPVKPAGKVNSKSAVTRIVMLCDICGDVGEMTNSGVKCRKHQVIKKGSRHAKN